MLPAPAPYKGCRMHGITGAARLGCQSWRRCGLGSQRSTSVQLLALCLRSMQGSCRLLDQPCQSAQRGCAAGGGLAARPLCLLHQAMEKQTQHRRPCATAGALRGVPLSPMTAPLAASRAAEVALHPRGIDVPWEKGSMDAVRENLWLSGHASRGEGCRARRVTRAGAQRASASPQGAPGSTSWPAPPPKRLPQPPGRS